MSGEITFAIDVNLGLPIHNQQWQQFFNKFNIKAIEYDNMKDLTDDMEKNTLTFSFPAANFSYFKDDKFYTPIANALFAANQTCKISSLLVVSRESQINILSDLKGKTLGYIHRFCTTSYFAPTLLLWRNHFSIHHFFSSMKEVGAWQLQIDAVINGTVDATMVQEDVWYRLPTNAEKTKIIAKEENLPSPLVICAQDVNKELKKEFTELLLSFPKLPVPSGALFNGFVPFQKDEIEKFYANVTKALFYP